MSTEHSPSVIDRTMSPLFINIAGIGLTPLLLAVVLGAYIARWKENPLAIFTSAATLEVILAALVVFFVSIAVHELLHSLGYQLGGVARQDIQFGFQWKALLPYSHCRVPVSARVYRRAVALPGLVLGLIPAVVGILFRLDWLALYGATMLAGAAGDLLTLVLLLPLKSNTQVLDHPSKPGFQILLD